MSGKSRANGNANRKLLASFWYWKFIFITGVIFASAFSVQAQERLCDNSFEDCRTPLWRLIDSETEGIDVAFWFMQDTSYATKLISRKNAGVRVRVIVDPRANPTYPGNQQILDQLQAAGIPMRYKLNEGILHNKAMIFAAQNKVEFSGANYNAAFEPFTPYTNYQDEVIYFSDDPAVVNSFKTKYDDLWTDTTSYGNYANITGPLTRAYPTTPIDPALNFPPSPDGSQDFRNRTIQHINQETQKVDAIMYRITNQDFTNAMIAAANRGITTRLMSEPDQYRDPARLWHSWNVDRMYMAGVQVKHRKHLGLNHQKSVLFYSQGLTAFGSSNWTGPSSNYQQEHNYFTTKLWFFQFFVNEFERKWHSSTEMEPFVPLPPAAPLNPSPANNASGQPTSVTLRWEGGYWAHKYDIYFGTNSTPPLIATNVETGTPGPDGAETFNVTGLAPGTTYYWRIVGKTMADRTASSSVFSFTTISGAPPANPPTVTSVLPATGSSFGGTTVTISGTGFATGATVTFGGVPATNVNVVNSTTISARAPAHAIGAVDVVVTNSNGGRGALMNGFTYTGSTPTPPPIFNLIYPETGTPNGGTSVTITGAGFTASTSVTIGGTPATNVVVANNGYTLTATTAAHAAGTMDVMVTNPDNQSSTRANCFKYVEPPPPPTITSISPSTGLTTGGTLITITGTDFNYGATVKLDGVLAQTITVINSTTITARTTSHSAGAVDVVVTNYQGPSVTSAGGFTYTNSSTTAPTISSVTPNSGLTDGGTAVTITGTRFVSGATVSFGGTAATNVNVTSATSITATTPAHNAGAVSVTVINPNNESATLNNAFTYISANAPTDIVLYASEATVRVGSFAVVADPTAAGGARIHNADAGAPKLTNALANPANYFEVNFNAEANTAYRLWVRSKAENNSPYNDSYFVQFSGSVNSGGGAVYRIGTTEATTINLEDCSGCGLAGWGWQDNGWGVGVMGPVIYFQNTGTHTLRIQPREDGFSIDQIVLSPQTYLNSSPGALKNDNTILPETGIPPAGVPTITSVTPNSGTAVGGTSVTISGTNFVSGATVTFGGTPATNVSVTNSTTITATTPAHAAGIVTVVVTNPDNQSGSLANGFTYDAPPAPAPTVSSVTPNSGTTAGGTAVTITGTDFVSGATVSFGGAAASNVNVVNGTSITATTPPHAAGAVNVVVTNADNQSGSLANGFTYTGTTPTLPTFGHVFVVVEENHSFSNVIGNSAMPYLNTLANRYGLAMNYYANTQPSIGNYFWLTTGQVVTNDSNFAGTVSVDNIVRQLLTAGKTWKSYAESLPSVGYTGGDQYPYVKRHNPFAYFSDVLNSPAQTNRLVPFSQFATDLANLQLPNYSFIIPNQLNNAHDCPASNPACTDASKLATADNWLKTNIDPLIASPLFQQDGLLVIVFDESVNGDTAHGGGHIAMLVISPQARQNFQSTTFYQHENTLRLMAEGLGLATFPGAAATASNMAEFFGATNTAPMVTGITPNTGTTAGGTTVTINGTGFVSTASVTFGGTQATNVTVVGSTTITATTPAHAAGAVNVTVINPNNQSSTLANGFTYSSSSPETVLLADDFNDNALDSAKWVSNNLFSGFTDASVTVSEKNQRLEIGPLKQNISGSHYNGIRSMTTYNFTGGYVYVELVQAASSATTADAMFTIGKDANNYYRIFVEAGTLICQRKVNGTKMDLFTMPYDPVNHRFWRIRHDSVASQVIFETATGSAGTPGVWTQRATQSWNTTAVPLSAVAFELKAGTWQVEATAPGTVMFDNFKAAKP